MGYKILGLTLVFTFQFCAYSEEIRGEILFVLYRVSVLQCAREDDEGADVLLTYGPKLLRFLMEVLMKSQSDEVRLNCIGVSFI